MSLVSIIVPVYNRADIVHETMESISQQDYIHWEVIFVDDGSTDESIKILKSYSDKDSRVRYYIRPTDLPKGANACRNYGLSLAKGIYIKWVDSDDLLVKSALSIQVLTLEANPTLKVCFGQGIFFNATTHNLEERWSRKVYSDSISWDYIRNSIRWPIGGPLWRKEFLPALPFDNTLKNSQEWLMHGLQLLRLKSGDYAIIEDDVYLIRRGNLRMSSYRDSRYYYNQAKARRILLLESFKTSSTIIFKLELLKQIMIYTFHSLIHTIRL
jgi:glycosyltransferase involved in cell wall biosynthesis